MANVKARKTTVALAASGLAMGLPLLILTFYRKEQWEDTLGIYPEVILRIALIAAILFGLYGLIRLAFLFFRPDARHVVGRPNAVTTLLLRSFAAENRRYGRSFGYYRLEDLLDWELGSGSSFVAIGDPRDLVPKLGALRAYADDGEWQQVFRTFAKRSRMIVAVVGDTPWLRWELQTLGSIEARERLVLVFPDVPPEERRKHLALVAEAMPEPVAAPAFQAFADSVRCIAFRPYGAPLVISSERGSKSAMSLEIALAAGLHKRT